MLCKFIFGYDPHESVEPKLSFVRRSGEEVVFTYTRQYYKVESEPFLCDSFGNLEYIIIYFNSNDVLILVLFLITQLILKGIRVDEKELVFVIQYKVPY